MKNIVILLVFFFLSALSKAQYVKWGKQFGPDYRGISPIAMTTDDAGNSYVIGNDRATITNVISFVQKISPTGQFLHLYPFQDYSCLAFMNFRKIAVDRAGFMWILGNSTCDNVQAGAFNISNPGGEIGSYLIKLNANGSVVFLVNLPDNMLDIAADYHSNIYVTGNNMTQKYDSIGNLSWSNTVAKGIALDVSPDGRSFVTNGTATFRLSNSGNISWKNIQLGGLDIAYNRSTGNFCLSNTNGLSIVQINPFCITHFSTMSGSEVKYDLAGNVFVRQQTLLKKMNNLNFYEGSVNVPFAIDFGISKNNQYYVLGKINNENPIQVGCSFTTTAGDPNFCPDNCRDDGFIVKVSFDPAPIITQYNYTSACFSQANPVNFCTEAAFNSNNVFYVELSGPNGGFYNPINVGTPPAIILPPGLAPGSNYKFRVNSTSPAITGLPSSPFTLSNTSGTLTISKVGQATLCDSGYVNIVAIDSLGNCITVDWFGDINYTGSYSLISTDDTLKITDYGTYYASGIDCFNLSPVVDANNFCRLAAQQTKLSLVVYPNPVSELLGVTITSAEDYSCFIELVDLSGRVRHRSQMPLLEGRNEIKLDLSSFESGVYILNANVGTQNWQRKVVKL